MLCPSILKEGTSPGELFPDFPPCGSGAAGMWEDGAGGAWNCVAVPGPNPPKVFLPRSGMRGINEPFPLQFLSHRNEFPREEWGY